MTQPPDNAPTITLRARITGRVQGVWFRAWTAREAEGLGLAGWVRNAPDGAVEALLSGPVPAVERMVAALHHGPPNARVTEVATTPSDEPPPPGFSITG